MGDFAAGKMLEGGVVTVQDIMPGESFAQFQVDFETHCQKLTCDAVMGAPGGAINGIVDNTGLIAELLAWHDGGIPIAEYFTLSSQEIADASSGFAEGFTPIMKDLDGTTMVMNADGELYVDDQPQGNLKGYLGLFLHELITGRYTWADGWVKQG
uniref:Uncharacterized protein n=1 Tax=Haptolina brevifila TaxID=156173 RepID=A0A7S2FFV0_9EUKA